MNARKKQAENTRLEICRAVEKLLNEKTAKNISIKDICTTANIGVGTFYHYYASKEEALYDLSTPIDIYFEETVLPLLENKNQYEQLILLFTHQAEYTVKNLHPSVNSKTEFLFLKNFFKDSRYFQKLLSSILSDGDLFNKHIEIMTLNGLTNHLLYLSRGVMISWMGIGATFDLKERVINEVNLFFELPKLLNENNSK